MICVSQYLMKVKMMQKLSQTAVLNSITKVMLKTFGFNSIIIHSLDLIKILGVSVTSELSFIN